MSRRIITSNVCLMAMVATSSHAFAPVMPHGGRPASHFNAAAIGRELLYFADEVPTDSSSSSSSASDDIAPVSPPSPPPLATAAAAAAQTVPPKKKSPAAAAANKNNHKEGIFSPPVKIAKQVFGNQEINKLRAKIISLHSDIIADFVDTSKTGFGDAVLTTLFKLADNNQDGVIQTDELAAALRGLGFVWLEEKQIQGIIQRADKDGNGVIDLNEWKAGAPKTLRTNLTKLAKKNGSEMGLLV